ncbi:MAG: site-specific DNA-methyltransferase [Candidatus Latescibacteria bacterium]|nr:site-specific DNA-methyltransferase [Candidatus Latescibacterota bacterium]
MHTTHRIIYHNAEELSELADQSVDLVVTSPPYPMIGMWDDLFVQWDTDIERALANEDGPKAFDLMHRRLDLVWKEVARVARDGAFVCVNIGDATRTIGSEFRLYPNHARILQGLQSVGLNLLPDILWHKQSNAPNKFMGSGMLPAGAYVTLEHEYILIARKGKKRVFSTSGQRMNRRSSALFWEERNVWFSDIWSDLKGTGQRIESHGSRTRSGAFPFELAYRLINMYSVKDDLVLDPFLGTGTSIQAAISSARNSIGFEVDENLDSLIVENMETGIRTGQERIDRRLSDHRAFISGREPTQHISTPYLFPVMTAHETDLYLEVPNSLTWLESNRCTVQYEV